MSGGRKVRWGVVSTAGTAIGKAIPGLLTCSNAELIAIASRDQAKASACASRFGLPRSYGSYQALLEDREIDAVYLPLPNSLHGEWTVRAAGAGKHVLCEKPAATDPAVVECMIGACAEARVCFQEGFMYRFHPQLAIVREWMDGTRIGEVRLIRISFSFPLENHHSRIRLQSVFDGGALADVGSYGIDLACWLINRQPDRVFAAGRCEFGADVETSFAALCEVTDGPHVLIDGGFDRPRQSRCEIVGSTGTISMGSPFLTGVEAELVISSDRGRESHRFPPQDLFRLQFERFSACVLAGTEQAIPPSETLRTARVQAALRESLTNGRPVELSVPGQPGTSVASADFANNK